METTIRPAEASDIGVMSRMFREVASRGDTIPSTEDISDETIDAQWLRPPTRSFLAVAGHRVLGMAKLGPNQAGRGAHVVTATFIVDPQSQGRGVGRSLLEHCLAEACRAGFRGMQFNYVVSSNVRAVRMYERRGFTVVGTVPRAFDHRALGLVDVLVMHLALPAGA